MANISYSNYSNIARPYAIAAFEYARDQQAQLDNWKAFLNAAALVVDDPSVAGLLANPEISKAKLYALFKEVLATQLDTARDNFLHLLANNARLIILPAIAELFNAYFAALEKISKVKVVTAIEVDEEYKKLLRQALTKRIHHEVNLHCEVDPTIIGGAIIHIGDKVIDASIREQLTRLLEFSLR